MDTQQLNNIKTVKYANLKLIAFMFCVVADKKKNLANPGII